MQSGEEGVGVGFVLVFLLPSQSAPQLRGVALYGQKGQKEQSQMGIYCSPEVLVKKKFQIIPSTARDS